MSSSGRRRVSTCKLICQETSVSLSNQEIIVAVNTGNSESWWAVTFQTQFNKTRTRTPPKIEDRLNISNKTTVCSHASDCEISLWRAARRFELFVDTSVATLIIMTMQAWRLAGSMFDILVQHVLLISAKHAQAPPRLMGISLFTQIFEHAPKHRTNGRLTGWWLLFLNRK